MLAAATLKYNLYIIIGSIVALKHFYEFAYTIGFR